MARSTTGARAGPKPSSRPTEAHRENLNPKGKGRRRVKPKPKLQPKGNVKARTRAMDIDEFLPKSTWINNAELRSRGGRYSGVVANVTAQEVRNPYAKPGEPKKQIQPVIHFEDGCRLIPNVPMRRELKERLGNDTDRWIGEQLVVELRVGKSGTGTKHLAWDLWRDEDTEHAIPDFGHELGDERGDEAEATPSEPLTRFGRGR
jgi:hypothetical protein